MMSMTADGDAYLAHLRGRGLRDATVKAYTGWVARLEAWADPRPLETLTTPDLEGWIGSHEWKPNSHQKAVQAVRYFYRWMHETGRISANPAAPLRPARSPAPVPSPCPEERYRAALDKASGQTYWRLRLAAETGLRRAELAGVHSDHVADLVTGPALIVTGKGGKRRWVPLPDDLAAWLRLQRGWVFPDRVGGHIAPPGVGAWYARLLGIKVHSLRHRYATLCYHAGHDISAVSALLGHSSVTTTQTYVAIAGEDLRAAAAGAWQVAS